MTGDSTLDRAARAIRRWWKCRVRGLHFYRFVDKNKDGSRLLRCTRCGREQLTNPRGSHWMGA